MNKITTWLRVEITDIRTAIELRMWVYALPSPLFRIYVRLSHKG